MPIRTLVLKVINNDRKSLIDHKIIDRIAEQIESVITQVYKELKFWIHPNPNLGRWRFSFTYSFKFTYFCIIYIYTYIYIYKTRTKHKNLSQINITERF